MDAEEKLNRFNSLVNLLISELCWVMCADAMEKILYRTFYS